MHLKQCDIAEITNANANYDAKQNDQDAPPENYLGTVEVRTELEPSTALEVGLHIVDWIGDIHKVVDEKEFYPSSSIKRQYIKYRIMPFSNWAMASQHLQSNRSMNLIMT